MRVSGCLESLRAIATEPINPPAISRSDANVQDMTDAELDTDFSTAGAVNKAAFT